MGKRLSIIAVLIILSLITGFGYFLFKSNYPEGWFSLRITHDGKPVQNIAVKLCYRWCNSQDIREYATDANGIVTIYVGFQLIPFPLNDNTDDSHWDFHFIANGTGYAIRALNHQLVDDPI